MDATNLVVVANSSTIVSIGRGKLEPFMLTCPVAYPYLYVDKLCYDICPSGFFGNASRCYPCSQAHCITCLSDICTLCDSTTHFILDTGLQQCVCQPTYYLSGSSCLSCSVGCLVCTDSSHCTSCNTAGNMAQVGNGCNCIQRFYLSTTVCVACSPYCLNCSSNLNTSCTACDSPKILQSSTCLCPGGSYLDVAGGYICSACHYSCLNCSAAGVSGCTVCDYSTNHRNLSSTSCVCDSANHYI
jgi:proprotein convertase subtilisin/kexin type 5